MSRVIVGMSGGVDSAVAAYLLKKEGYEVIGVTLRTWVGEDEEESRCCEIDEARNIAKILDIEYHVYNTLSEFKNCVVTPFIMDYVHGRTPNPCVECNRYVKWDKMLYIANVLQAEYVATGHYAKIVKLENGRYTVKTGKSQKKDQTYMLYKLSQEQLSRTLMPLGDYDKDEVRQIAERIGLSIANKPDSQEICFVTDGKYSDFIKNNTKNLTFEKGNFVDEEGNILGTHNGIINYTVGQRRGLNLSMGEPVYVKRIDTVKNEVVICRDADLYTNEIFCDDINYLSVEEIKEGDKIDALVKIRYQHKGDKAIIERIDTNRIKVTFEKAVRAATPGQSAVFYDSKGAVIGGGKICCNES